MYKVTGVDFIHEQRENYLIVNETAFFIPFYDLEYQSLVFEGEKKILVKQTPQEIIDQTCERNGFLSYRQFVPIKKKMKYRKSLPICYHSMQNKIIFSVQHTMTKEKIWFNLEAIDRFDSGKIEFYSKLELMIKGFKFLAFRTSYERACTLSYRIEQTSRF